MIPLLAAALLLAAAWPRRPRPGRSPAPPTSPRRASRRRLVVVAGIAVLAVVAGPVPALLAAGAVPLWPRWVARREAARRRWLVVEAVPEAADLLALAVAGGMTVPLAVEAAARWTPGPVGEALRQGARQLDLGRPTADVLEGVADAVGPPVRPLVDVLLASERYGVPLGERLDRVAHDARLERRRRGEERARRVPVLLLFPLVLCVLPAFAFLTVVPLLVGSLPDLPP